MIISSSSVQINNDYHNAENRILFLDYDGTLVSFADFPELAIIDDKTLGIINKLSEDNKNQVIIISGRDKYFLDKQFKEMNVSLIAEHGFFIKVAGQSWESAVNPDLKWKEEVLPFLNKYSRRCNGTFIEEKTGSLAWHYRKADQVKAGMLLAELLNDLSEIIDSRSDFEILEGEKVIEVKCSSYNKGLAAKTIMKDKLYDFVLAAGDDKTDESLFKVLPDSSYTIRIGMSPSAAKYNVSDISRLLELLDSLMD